MTILRAASTAAVLLFAAACTQPDATDTAPDDPTTSALVTPMAPDDLEIVEPPPPPPPEASGAAEAAAAGDADPSAKSPTADPMTDQSKSTPRPTLETATFAGGCFWCIEAVLDRLEGVSEVQSGYMGGDVDNPTYRQVCDGVTGHAEVVQFRFDPTVTSYEKLVGYFFAMHDPTTLNRQGNDVGTQYRSAIYFHSDAQEKTAKQVIEKITPKFDRPIVTEVTAASRFWPAEAYHQDYWEKNPNDRYCNAFIPSKLDKLGLER